MAASWEIETTAVSVNCMTYAQGVRNRVFQPKYLVKTLNIFKNPVSLFGVRNILSGRATAIFVGEGSPTIPANN
jgi:hypothetical protein